MINVCGRYEALPMEVINDLLGEMRSDINRDINDIKYGEVFPTNNGLVELKDGYTIMNWGTPHWKLKKSIINARQETLDEKPFFMHDFRERRCVVLAKGFYEWNSDKVKQEIVRDDQPIMKIAGLYKIDKEGVPHFVIITQEATKEFEPIHNRLPLILEDNEVQEYLNSDDIHKWTYPKDMQAISWEPASN